MRHIRKGVASTVVAALVVVLVVVGAGAYFVILSPQNAGSTGGSSSGSSSTASSSSRGATSSVTSSQSYSTTQPTYTTSTASSVSTTSSVSSTSCPTTTSTVSGSSSNVLNFSLFFSAYSEMNVEFNGTYNGAIATVTADYHVLYSSSTTYKVNINENTSGSTLDYTVWVQKDGTPVAVYYGGQNYTGVYASSLFLSAMAAYTIEAAFATPQFLSEVTSSAFSHQTGQATVMIGPTSVSVTDYVANNLPLMIDQCGFNANFSRFSVQTGAVAGETLPLLTTLNLSGSFTANGSSQNVDLTFHIMSLTKSS